MTFLQENDFKNTNKKAKKQTKKNNIYTLLFSYMKLSYTKLCVFCNT